ncbi:MAG TPA: gephyrin-like molybdotransferase Glp [Terracidiphilus sp.]|jgi:molybdopterin molybdotransferase
MVAALPSFPEAARAVYDYAAQLLAHAPRLERVPLQAATGRILARPIRADRDMPAFSRSTRDGFAVRAREASAGEWLHVRGSIRAGQAPAGPLPAVSAWEIMTGAAVPEGADAVAMLEHVESAHGENEASRIRLAHRRKLNGGENVVSAGAEAHAGEELVAAGSCLGCSQIAAAATCGYDKVDVFARPRVAILTTGDELVPVGETPGPSQIRNSNALMLAALVNQSGGDAWVLPVVRDESKAIASALQSAMQADMLLISGGVSAGKFDLVEPVLSQLGARFHFTGVRMQPGKPLVFGEIDRGGVVVPLFGLPGNPISSAATYLLFASAVLRGLAGVQQPAPHFAAAQLSREARGKPNLTRFIPSAVTSDPLSGELAQVAPVPWQGSGDLAAFARANCFIVVPEGTDRLAENDVARILPI